MIPEIWIAADRIFSHFGPFFALLAPPPLPPLPLAVQKMNISKKNDNIWRYHHFTQLYQKLRL